MTLNSLPPPNRHNTAPDPQPRPDPSGVDRTATSPAPHHQDRPGQRPIAIHPGEIADQNAASLAAASPAGDYQDEVTEIGERAAQDAGGALAGGEGVAHGANIVGTLGRRERPILFSVPMIRAILSGAKTQTRRALKETVPPSPAMDAINPHNIGKALHPAPYLDSYCGDRKTAANPRGMSNRWCWWTRDDRQGLPTFPVRWVPGDRLWVRETWCAVNDTAYGGEKWVDYRATPKFSADHPAGWENDPSDPIALKWRPSIFMPRWASRITLEVVGVRVERLQDINNADALAEGTLEATEVPYIGSMTSEMARHAYALLWDHINGAGSWAANPWVVAVEFRRVGADER